MDVVHDRPGLKDELTRHVENVDVVTAEMCADDDVQKGREADAEERSRIHLY